MPARITIERVLRDDDDDSGQTIRDWKIEADRFGVMIRMKHGTGFILIRAADVDVLVSDLQRAKATALQLAEEKEE